MRYIPGFLCLLHMACASEQSMTHGDCQLARYEAPGGQFRIEDKYAYDTTASSVAVSVYDLGTLRPLPASMRLVRDGDTLRGVAEEAGISSVRRNGIQGFWDLYLSADGYRCFLIRDVLVEEGHGQLISVGLRRK